MSTPNSYITCIANAADLAEVVALLADDSMGATRESTAHCFHERLGLAARQKGVKLEIK